MMGIIVWIIVLGVIISNVKKGQKSVKTDAPSQPNVPQKKQPVVKQQRVSKPKTDILARAAANVSEDFEEKQSASEEIVKDLVNKKLERMTKTQMVQEADVAAEVDLYKVFDVPQMQQESELMKTVSDIMVKGVNTELPFQRDFVAEGMEMINSMTL